MRGIRAVQDRVLSRLSAADLRLTHRWEAIHAVAGELTQAGLAKLLADPDVVRVDLDVDGGAQLWQSVPLVNANDAHGLGYTGQGVTVAVLDSGVDASHPDLGDALVAEHCFCTTSTGTGCCPNGSTEQAGTGSARDDYGHGTNVTGIITSNGIIAPTGVAPSAQIVAVRVLDGSGGFAASAQVVSGLNWIIQNRPDVKVLNMSLATSTLFAGTCDNAYAWTMAFAEAINTLKSHGVTVFAASGNSGSTTQLPAPACVASVPSHLILDNARGACSHGPCSLRRCRWRSAPASNSSSRPWCARGPRRSAWRADAR
jgi:subtilisin family serine protease